MSFNLNKSEEPSGPSKKSNFDLSKSDKNAGHPDRRRPAYWLYALIAVLITGGIAWYLIPHGNREQMLSNRAPAASTVPRADSSVTRQDSGLTIRETGTTHIPHQGNVGTKPDPDSGAQPAIKQPSAVAGDVASGSVVAASFKAGSSRPLMDPKSLTLVRAKIKNGEITKINIFGYASSEGALNINQSISQARADNYRKLLIRKGVAGDIIHAKGRGIQNPIAPNDTEDGRQKNRRVEVSF